MFYFKNHPENEAGRLVPDLFLFLKKRYTGSRQVVCILVSLYLDSPYISMQQKQTI